MRRRWFLAPVFICGVALAALAQDPNPSPTDPNETEAPQVAGSTPGGDSPAQEDAKGAPWAAIGVVAGVLAVVVSALALIRLVRRDRPPHKVQDAELDERGRLQEKDTFARQEDVQQATADEQDYLKQIRAECEKIQMLGAGDCPNITVPTLTTFVSLRMSGGWDQEGQMRQADRVHSSEQAIADARRLGRPMVILGDAGSGKTTLLKYYVMSCLSDSRYTPLGFDRRPLPLFYALRQLKPKDRMPDSLPENLARWAREHHLDIPAKRFDHWLRRPGTLVLLDGLDEICDPAQRQRVCRWIDSAVRAFDKAYFVVTSRRTGYRRTDHISLECKPEPIEVHIEDFTPDQQAQFLKAWFKQAYLARTYTGSEMEPERWKHEQVQEALHRAQIVNDYLNRPENKAVRELARVPLILQVIAILWKDRISCSRQIRK